MAKQTINLGTGELTGDGESIRSAFDKINNNFDELYATEHDLSSISQSIIPDTDVAYDLGSASNRFRDLYLSGSTIDLGGTTLSIVGGELQLGGVKVPTTADVAATVASAVSAPAGDLTGSVFADDSTLLVDGVAGKIVGDVETDSLTVGGTGFVNLNNDAQGDTFYGGATTDKAILLLKGADYLAGSDNGGGIVIQGGSARNSGDNGDVTIASGNGGATGTGSVAIIADNILGLTANEISVSGKFKNPLFADIIGSVFADDSTLLVDGVNGKLIGDVVTTSITNANDIDIASEDDVAIITSAGNNNHEWFFNSGGYLDFPDNGELHFNGDGGIQFFTPYDPEAGTTANITIRDTGSTAELDIVNEATNGTIDITTEGILTLRTTANDMRLYAAGDFYFEAGEGANDFTVNAGLIELGGDVELDGTLTFPDATVQSTAYVERFVNRSLFSGDVTVSSGSANLLQFDAHQGQQAFDAVTYQWTPANTGLYRLDFVLGLTQSEVDLDIVVFLYNVTANSNQITLYNGSFTGSVLSMSGTVYLMAGQNFQFGIIQQSLGDITLDSQLTSAGIEELARLS